MREFSINNKLRKILKKLNKKDIVTHDIIMDKIREIISCEDVDHYKNLRNPLQDYKRVHIKKSFVLRFKYNKSEDKVHFYDFGHHDDIYD